MALLVKNAHAEKENSADEKNAQKNKFSMKIKECLKPNTILCESIIIALLLTAIFFVTFDKQPYYDSVRNLEIAKEITERGIPTYFNFSYWQHPPLFHYMIAAAAIIFNVNVYLGAKIVILLTAFFSLMLFYMLCNDIRGRDFARLSTVILAFTPLFWTWGVGEIMQSVGEVFYYITTIFLFNRAIKKTGKKYYILTGIFMGLGILHRVSALVLFAILPLYMILEKRKSIFSFLRTNIINLILVLLASGIVVSPYLIFRAANNGPSILNQALSETFAGKAGFSATGTITSPMFLYFTNFFEIASISVIFFIIGLVYFFKKAEWGMLLPVVWFLLTISVLSLFSVKEARFMIIGLPAIIMISSYGIFEIKKYFKRKEIFYGVIGCFLAILFITSALQNINDGYHPVNFKMWDYLNNEVDADILSKDIYGEDFNVSVFRMPYNTVKLMINKYSDYVPIEDNEQREIYYAISFGTPFILYPHDPSYSGKSVTKVKFFDECNCSLYMVNDSFFSGIPRFETVDQNGKPIGSVKIEYYDTRGEHVFGSASNSSGTAFAPFDKFVGVMAADKICYNSIQMLIKIENGVLYFCENRVVYEGLVQKNILDCAPQENKIQLAYKGCLLNQYGRDRF